MLIKTLLLVVVLGAFSTPLLADTDPEVASYGIPADAIKRGPLPSRDSREIRYAYFPSGAAITPENVIAYEAFLGEALVKRDLFKGGVRYGIQREWYNDGTIRSEAPYKNDLMDGTFRRWDDRQQLVAQYEMKNGAGKRRSYYSTGQLQLEEDIKDNERNGLTIALYENGQVDYVAQFKAGLSSGLAVGYYPNGAIYYTAWPTGPFIYFTKTGKVKSKKWRLKGMEVSEKSYAIAAAKERQLPPYYTDTERYKKLAQATYSSLIKRYHALPKVSIPLESHKK